MLFGLFFPLVLVIVLGLLVGIIVLLREIRKMTGVFRGTGPRKHAPLAGQSTAQELNARYKPYRQNVPERRSETTKNESESAGGVQWRW